MCVGPVCVAQSCAHRCFTCCPPRIPSPLFLVVQIKTAMGVLTSMQNEGIEPDEIVYRALLEACGRCGSTQYAAQVLAEVQRANIQPDSSLLSCVLRAFTMDASASASLPSNFLEWNKMHNAARVVSADRGSHGIMWRFRSKTATPSHQIHKSPAQEARLRMQQAQAQQQQALHHQQQQQQHGHAHAAASSNGLGSSGLVSPSLRRFGSMPPLHPAAPIAHVNSIGSNGSVHGSVSSSGSGATGSAGPTAPAPAPSTAASGHGLPSVSASANASASNADAATSGDGHDGSHGGRAGAGTADNHDHDHGHDHGSGAAASSSSSGPPNGGTDDGARSVTPTLSTTPTPGPSPSPAPTPDHGGDATVPSAPHGDGDVPPTAGSSADTLDAALAAAPAVETKATTRFSLARLLGRASSTPSTQGTPVGDGNGGAHGPAAAGGHATTAIVVKTDLSAASLTSTITTGDMDGHSEASLSTLATSVSAALAPAVPDYGPLSEYFPDLVINTARETCPARDCGRALTETDIRTGWLRDSNEYTTVCPSCKDREEAERAALLARLGLGDRRRSGGGAKAGLPPSGAAAGAQIFDKSGNPVARFIAPRFVARFVVTTTHPKWVGSTGVCVCVLCGSVWEGGREGGREGDARCVYVCAISVDQCQQCGRMASRVAGWLGRLACNPLPKLRYRSLVCASLW